MFLNAENMCIEIFSTPMRCVSLIIYIIFYLGYFLCLRFILVTWLDEINLWFMFRNVYFTYNTIHLLHPSKIKYSYCSLSLCTENAIKFSWNEFYEVISFIILQVYCKKGLVFVALSISFFIESFSNKSCCWRLQFQNSL